MKAVLRALLFVVIATPALAQAPKQAPLSLDGSAAAEPWQRYKDWNKARWDSFNTMARSDVSPPVGKEIEIATVTAIR